MSKIKLALDVVEDLRSLADSIETLAGTVEGNKPKEKVEVNLPTLEEVRAKLASLSKAGKQAQVRELITGFGVKKLSDIPREKYPELLKKAEVM
ncbi:hypothetical protein [Paratissierella segnis]|uniref:rRNA biogenesis protein rrp5 n=1 Tax=Paratissierella segnis TaxID=2763679 RepID=A0A926EU01_9FIRM|nr:hypothetical protein [Paratissierella segnis]MBC8587462.1 rRNA biogenesis protein rrp5 [Paratissierella segnis]